MPQKTQSPRVLLLKCYLTKKLPPNQITNEDPTANPYSPQSIVIDTICDRDYTQTYRLDKETEP